MVNWIPFFCILLISDRGVGAEDSLNVFGKDRFGADGAPSKSSPRYFAPRTDRKSGVGLQSKDDCTAKEIDSTEAKGIWKLPAGYCEAAVTKAHCVWDAIEARWSVVKHEKSKFCRTINYLGFEIITPPEFLGLGVTRVFPFFLSKLLEDHGPFNSIVLLIPCNGSRNELKEIPSAEVLATVKAVNCPL